MDFPVLNTERCSLVSATVEDAEWMFKLFNDEDVVSYIEGIKWFNSDIETVKKFIEAMNVNFRKNLGILWSVILHEKPIGIIMVNDLPDNPFLTFAIFDQYRGNGLGSEIYSCVKKFIKEKYSEPEIVTENPIVKKIIRHQAEFLFLNNQYQTF